MADPPGEGCAARWPGSLPHRRDAGVVAVSREASLHQAVPQEEQPGLQHVGHAVGRDAVERPRHVEDVHVAARHLLLAGQPDQLGVEVEGGGGGRPAVGEQFEEVEVVLRVLGAGALEPPRRWHAQLERPHLENRQVEPPPVERHHGVAGDALPGAPQEGRLVASPVGPGGGVDHPQRAVPLLGLERAGHHGPVVGNGQEVGAAAASGAPLVEQPAELLGVGAVGLAVDGRDEVLVGDGLQVEGDEPAGWHGTDGTGPV